MTDYGIFSDLSIRSTKGSHSIFAMLMSFAKNSAQWQFDSEKTDIYSKSLGKRGLALSHKLAETDCVLAFCEKGPKEVYLANIVPQNGQIPARAYNNIVANLYHDLKGAKEVRTTAFRLLHLPPEKQLCLQHIIPSAVARNQFNQYLSGHPRSYHPTDIERLNKLVCAYSRYSRKKGTLAATKAIFG